MTTKKKNKIEDREFRCTGSVQLRAAEGENESRTVEGYAAVFEKLSKVIHGWFREKIERGAFDDVLNDDVVAVFNHNDNIILARTASGTLKLEVDNTGLKYSFEAPNTTAANDLLESIKRGDINKSSFRFIIGEDAWNKDENDMDVRSIKKFAKLIDVSPVVFEAYPDTSVAKRSFDEHNKQKPPANEVSDLYFKEKELQLKE